MRLLGELGYRDVRYYAGGLEDWRSHGGTLVAMQALGGGQARPVPRGVVETIATVLDDASTARVLGLWAGIVVCAALLAWLSALVPGHTLLEGGTPIGLDLHGLGVAAYFSLVTATSVGYGDVVPLGAMRAVALVEAVSTLLVFGVLVAKFVGRRQEQVVAEIHRLAFEDRMNRVEANLHALLGDLHAMASLLESDRPRHDRVAARLDSLSTLLSAELRTVHDLLYRPQSTPEEAVFQGVLASLSACLRELRGVVHGVPAGLRSTALASNLRLVGILAVEICGECVPREHSRALREWMDRIQEDARGLGAAA